MDDKHILIAFGSGFGLGLSLGIGSVSFLFGRKYFLNKKLKKKEESLLNDDSVDVKDYLKWKDDHKF